MKYSKFYSDVTSKVHSAGTNVRTNRAIKEVEQFIIMPPKRTCRQLPMAEKTPPDVKRIRKEQKYHVNRQIAVELVKKPPPDDRVRAEKGVAERVMNNYKAVYDESLIDKNMIYRFKREILAGKAGSWLPPDADIPETVKVANFPNDTQTDVSGITMDPYIIEERISSALLK